MAEDVNIDVPHTVIRLSPLLFKNTARDFFKCYLDFKPYGKHISPVPFFLCCRAIEMAFKSIHMETKDRNYIKKLGHDLVKLYENLEKKHKTLSKNKLALLDQSNKIYIDKDFEYLSVIHPVTGFKEFPDLESLGELTKKITGFDEITTTDGRVVGGGITLTVAQEA